MRAGSSSSNGDGVPLLTAQKRQVRVQRAPININVAVPLAQHSPLLGQRPLSQIVLSFCSFKIVLVSRFSSVLSTERFTHSGSRRGFSS